MRKQVDEDDIWAIRLMRGILRMIGVKGAVIVAANDRNWQTVLAAKQCGLPTIGILHGINTHHYNMYDFLPGFTALFRVALQGIEIILV